MSDERLRELERQWRRTGSTADEAAWLRERARLGQLGRDRLELAAHWGSVAAREVIGPDGLVERLGPIPRRATGKAPWIALRAWGIEVVVRAAHAAAEEALRYAPADDVTGLERAARAALVATREWLECPCDDHAGAAGRQASDLLEVIRQVSESGAIPHYRDLEWAAAAGPATTSIEEPIDGAYAATAASFARHTATGEPLDHCQRAVWDVIARRLREWALAVDARE